MLLCSIILFIYLFFCFFPLLCFLFLQGMLGTKWSAEKKKRTGERFSLKSVRWTVKLWAHETWELNLDSHFWEEQIERTDVNSRLTYLMDNGSFAPTAASQRQLLLFSCSPNVGPASAKRARRLMSDRQTDNSREVRKDKELIERCVKHVELV